MIEMRIDEMSVLAGRPIEEAIPDLPPGVVVGALTRDGSFLIPRGDTVVEPGDHAVILADSDVVEELVDLL